MSKSIFSTYDSKTPKNLNGKFLDKIDYGEMEIDKSIDYKNCFEIVYYPDGSYIPCLVEKKVEEYMSRRVCDGNGRTILHVLADYRAVEDMIIRVLLSENYSMYDLDNEGYTPIDGAMKYGCEKNIYLLRFIEENGYIPTVLESYSFIKRKYGPIKILDDSKTKYKSLEGNDD